MQIIIIYEGQKLSLKDFEKTCKDRTLFLRTISFISMIKKEEEKKGRKPKKLKIQIQKESYALSGKVDEVDD